MPIIGWSVTLRQLLENHENELEASQNHLFWRFLRSWPLRYDLHTSVDEFTFISSLVVLEYTDQAVFGDVLDASIEFLNLVKQQ